MKILVVDDHVLIRDALHDVLKELKSEAIIIEASDCRGALQLVEEHPDLDLVLLDLTLPDGNGLALLEMLRNQCPAVGIAVLSAFYEPANVTKAFELGVVGFIPKSAERTVMLAALQLIFCGGTYIPPEILASKQLGAWVPAAQSAAAQPADLGLTARQLEVLALMMQGCSNKSICRLLDLAEPTVKVHVSAILKALKVSTRMEAVIAVGKLGWELKLPRIA